MICFSQFGYCGRMEFTRELNLSINIVRAYHPGQITVGGRQYAGNLILTPDTIIEDWEIENHLALTDKDVQPVIALKPEIVLLGTGDKIKFPDASVHHAFLSRGIGFEVMDAAAACRTYNVLAHEDRRVAAALFLHGR